MSGAFRTQERLTVILGRQSAPAWGATYQAAIRATPLEGPRISRLTILRPRKVGGRDTHLLSDAETAFALLALYHPLVFDFHEQHVLATGPAQHPLATHPKARGRKLASLCGTVPAAAAMERLRKHQKLFILGESGEEGAWVPFPYIGDQLLFLDSSDGPYCLNWTIKDTPQAFRGQGLGLRPLRRRRNDADAEFRHELEANHFESAEIRTQRLARDELDTNLELNLRRLHAWDSRKSDLSDDQIEHATLALLEIVAAAPCLLHAVKAVAKSCHASIESINGVLYSAIWCRRIRADLFKPILADKPLQPEVVDPLVRYASWFGR